MDGSGLLRSPRRARTRAAAGATLLAISLLAGCAAHPAEPDPGLQALAGDALSATRTAELGLRLQSDGRMLGTTTRTLLGDMAEALADTARELQLYETDSAANGALRLSLLETTRAAGDTVHRAQHGGAGAVGELHELADALEEGAGG
jgi:hypothetical protein